MKFLSSIWLSFPCFMNGFNFAYQFVIDLMLLNLRVQHCLLLCWYQLLCRFDAYFFIMLSVTMWVLKALRIRIGNIYWPKNKHLVNSIRNIRVKRDILLLKEASWLLSLIPNSRSKIYKIKNISEYRVPVDRLIYMIYIKGNRHMDT